MRKEMLFLRYLQAMPNLLETIRFHTFTEHVTTTVLLCLEAGSEDVSICNKDKNIPFP